MRRNYAVTFYSYMADRHETRRIEAESSASAHMIALKMLEKRHWAYNAEVITGGRKVFRIKKPNITQL